MGQLVCRYTMLIYAAGVVLAFVIAVPDWPYFNQHPQRWLAIDADHPNWNGGENKEKGSSVGAAAGNSNAAGGGGAKSKAGKKR
jgi:hypothetical protein